MTYKELLVELNTIPKTERPAARAFILKEKQKGTPAADIWKMIDKKEVLTGDVVGGSFNPVNDAGDLNMSEIENKVNQALEDFMTQANIDDMTKAPQRQFSAASMYIGRHVFKGTDILKDKTIFDNGSAIRTNCQRYDINKLVQVLDLYVYICTKYNKAFTLDGGAYFCGVSDNYITQNKQKLTEAGFDPNKKAEQTIAAGLLDGKINAVGSIAWLNYNAKWSQPVQETAPARVPVVEYPVLGVASDKK